MSKELKDLWLLAAWAIVATCAMGFAGAWHPKSYTVVQAAAVRPSATPSGSAAVASLPQ